MKVELQLHDRLLGLMPEGRLHDIVLERLQQLIRIRLECEKVILQFATDQPLNDKMEKKTSIVLDLHTPVRVSVSDGETIIPLGEFEVGDLFGRSQDPALFWTTGAEENMRGISRPSIAGEFDAKDRGQFRSMLKMEAVADNSHPYASIGDFPIVQVAREKSWGISVLVNEDVYGAFIRDRKYSRRYEEGGFLVGDVFFDRDRPSAYIVRITDRIEASHVGASAVQLVFTGETFSQLNKTLQTPTFSQKKLLSWYHTHLFPANHSSMELSPPDVNLHCTTFKLPWQTAGLINLESDGTNKLRFYAKIADKWEMKQVPYWVVQRS